MDFINRVIGSSVHFYGWTRGTFSALTNVNKTLIGAVCVVDFIVVVTRNKLNFIMQKLRVIS